MKGGRLTRYWLLWYRLCCPVRQGYGSRGCRTSSDCSFDRGIEDCGAEFVFVCLRALQLFSHSPNKAADALRLGADKFVATGDKDFAKTAGYGIANGGREFDFILSTADANSIPLADFLP